MKNSLDGVKSRGDTPQGWKFYNICSWDSRRKAKNEWAKELFKYLMTKNSPKLIALYLEMSSECFTNPKVR